MTVDIALGLAGIILGVVGIGATIWAAFDARKQRSAREKAVLAATNVIERTYGLLVGIKPSVASSGSMPIDAINDGLAAINAQRDELKNL
ncbi:hypothetical protein LGM58_35950 [Burkholderia contaminans]|uniref:hypothetical protein n=1 Tax=Burkholderia contaminans TaxID=488447 RepID=UPI001CF0DD33|nr:hypothetical protein [Burkholderia contaminans]MCA7888579.1 hypothetical protein [Burkholderia contaminans]